MEYDFNKIISREGTHSIKWEQMPVVEGKKRDELLPLWIADMDFPCAQPVLLAMHERIDRQIFGYTGTDEREYHESIQNWFNKHFDWHIDIEHIMHSPGVVPALVILVRALTKPGDAVIVQQPVYYPFMRVIKNNDREVLNNSLLEKDGEYFMDFDDLEEKASRPDTKMIFLCSPHNPIGRVWKEEELKKLSEICLKNNVYIISDEIHCDILRKGVRHIPMAVISSDDRVISCTAASKTFNLAGLQTSNIILRSAKLRKKWSDEIHGKSNLFGGNPLGIVATKTAYTEGEPWLEQVLTYIDENLRYIEKFLKDYLPKAKYHFPEGTYFAWIDFRSYGYDSHELERRLLKEGGVFLDEGYIFGEEGSGFERINTACPRSILVECMSRIREEILK